MSTTAVDVPLLCRLLRRIEMDAHRAGWDQPPALFVLYDARADDGGTDRAYRRLMGQNPRLRPATRVPPYVAQAFLDGPHFAAGDKPLWEQVRRFALNLAYGDGDYEQIAVMRGALSAPGVLGFAYLGEGYALAVKGRAAAADMFGGTRDLAEEAGAVETRMLYAADVTNRLYVLTRSRGRKPELDDNAGADMRGDFTTSLRLLVAAATGTVPPAEEYALHFPRLAELLRKPDDPLAEPPHE